jgi:hypothetical protein
MYGYGIGNNKYFVGYYGSGNTHTTYLRFK